MPDDRLNVTRHNGDYTPPWVGDKRTTRERWTVMSRTPNEGGYGWLTIIAGPQVGEDGETFEVMRAEVTDEMIERVADALHDFASYNAERHEIARAALTAAFSTQHDQGGER